MLQENNFSSVLHGSVCRSECCHNIGDWKLETKSKRLNIEVVVISYVISLTVMEAEPSFLMELLVRKKWFMQAALLNSCCLDLQDIAPVI